MNSGIQIGTVRCGLWLRGSGVGGDRLAARCASAATQSPFEAGFLTEGN